MQSDTNAVLKILQGGQGFSLLVGAFNLLSGSIARYGGSISTGGIGAGTVVSHGMGATPSSISCCPSPSQPGSATIGVGVIGSTTFTVTVGTGSFITWIALG